ncbi:MAG: hypothetical protein IPH94_19150 [Saprospiraceae bacterium]|nr:hypothetical protein [Saprospiraceae bacterium]
MIICHRQREDDGGPLFKTLLDPTASETAIKELAEDEKLEAGFDCLPTVLTERGITALGRAAWV